MRLAAKKPHIGDTRPATVVLISVLQGFGLSRYEARVLVVLLVAGSANSSQLAKLADIPRTSTYRTMAALIERRLADRLPEPGPAAWATAGWEAVVEVLDMAEQERLRQRRDRINRLRQTLAATSHTQKME